VLVVAKIVKFTDGLLVQIQRFPKIFDSVLGSLVPAGDEELSETAMEDEEYHWDDILAAGWRVLGCS